MAKPMVHLVPSILLTGAALIWERPEKLLDRYHIIVLSILFLGVLVDVDHFSLHLIRLLLQGKKGDVKDWAGGLNLFHTSDMLEAVFLFSIIAGSVWPAVSYLVHIGIDSFAYEVICFARQKPLPAALSLWVPWQWRYKTFGHKKEV